MIYLAGEPDDIWWNGEVQEVYLGADLIWKSAPDIEIFDVSASRLSGSGREHPLLSITVPEGHTWEVYVQGHFTSSGNYPGGNQWPQLRVGGSTSSRFGEGSAEFSGTITPENPTIAVVTNRALSTSAISFVGTVTVTKP